MAKTAIRTRKKVKKQVADGLAHIHASFVLDHGFSCAWSS